MLPALLAFVFGYLLGSFPSGVVIARLAGVADPRGIGSGNIGATNVLRTGRKDLAAFTLLADAAKGTVAVVVARAFVGPSGTDLLPLVAAAGAFLGHLFSVFLGFKGGKGVATFLGCLFGIAWPVALGFCGIWIAVALLTRYSSASALAASAGVPLIFVVLARHADAGVFALLACALWAKHHGNIARLLSGTENRLGRTRREAPSVP